MRRLLVQFFAVPAVFLGCLSGTVTPGVAVAQAGNVAVVSPAIVASATDFVEKLSQTVIDALKDGVLTGEKGEQWFRQFIQTNFETDTIARFSIGRYWRVATPEQQKEYLSLFQEMIVKVYTRRFRDYSGETIKVVNAQSAGDNDIFVTTLFQPVGKPPVNTQWRVRVQRDGSFKIVDLVVENISMAVTQRAEFASIIEQYGGQVEPLLASLRQRIEASAGSVK